MTPTQFAEKFGMTRQNVLYHLNKGHIPGASLLSSESGGTIWMLPNNARIERLQRGRPTLGETAYAHNR